MKKLLFALVLALLVVAVLAGPALADGGGVSATGLGLCVLNPLHAPGTGPASHIWVPAEAAQNLNGGNSGLHFMMAP